MRRAYGRLRLTHQKVSYSSLTLVLELVTYYGPYAAATKPITSRSIYPALFNQGPSPTLPQTTLGRSKQASIEKLYKITIRYYLFIRKKRIKRP